MMLVGDILRRNAKLYGRKVGLIDGDKAFTYGEINSRVNRLSNALRGLGLKKGNKVAFMAHNRHQFVEAYFAVAKSGLVIVPINARLSLEEASHVVNHSDAVTFMYGDEVESIAKDLIKWTPHVKCSISIGKRNGSEYLYESLLEGASDEEPDEKIEPDNTMMIMYTGGTTGSPKGVLASQRNIMSNTNTMVLELRIVQEDITLVVMPLFHNGGLWPTMTHFYRGGTVVLLPRFQEDRVLQLVEKEKVSVLNLVATMLLRFISHPDFDRYDLSSLRLIMHGGGPISMDLLTRAMRILGPHRFYTSLGCTEANGMLTSFPTTEHALEGPLAEKLGSVGRDAIGVDIRIVNEDGIEQPSGKVGEIIAKGEHISAGYWKMPEETAETFREGWLYLGDLGYRDEDGYIFVVDRKTDIIISGGENISSSEVEGVICQHPAVKEVAVIGVPDEEWGEAVLAVISLKTEYKGKLAEGDFIDFCNTRLAGFKKPKSVHFMEDLPKTSLGKIAKGDLKEFFKGS